MNSKRGIGYAHQAPLALRLRQGQLQRPEKLAERWNIRWLADATLASKRTADPAANFLSLHALWTDRMRRVLAASVSWASILRKDYDSPFIAPDEFDRNLRDAIERRTREMGKRKGVRHPRVLHLSKRLANSRARKIAREFAREQEKE